MKTNELIFAIRDRSETKKIAQHILLILASRADQEGFCYPSYRDIAKVTGYSLSKVARAIKEIVETGELRIINQGGSLKGGQRQAAEYQILVGSRKRDRSTADYGPSLLTVVPETTVATPDRSTAYHPTVVPQPTDRSTAYHPTHHEHTNEHTRARERASDRCSSATDPPIPETLQTPAFQRAWTEWQEYRRQIRKPLKRLSLQKQLKKLESLGPDRAIAEIDQSIEKGWLGLFEPKAVSGSNGQKSKPVNKFNPRNL